MATLARIGTVVACALLVLFATSLLTAISIDRGRYVQVASDAARDGTLATTTVLPLAPEVRRPVFNFNDCLILSMLVVPQRGTLVERAISPLIPANDPALILPKGYPPYAQCADLAAVLDGRDWPSGHYHRYLHGHWVLAGALLAVLSFGTATTLLYLIAIGLLAALALLSARAVFFGPRDMHPRNLAFLAFSGFLAAFYALPAYSRSLSFAPSDIVLIGFVLFAWVRPLSSLTERHFVEVVALFGVLTAIFEFLIGAIPAGAAMLLGMLALDPPPVQGVLLRRAVLGLACFAGAIALTFAAKAVIVVLLWGWPEIANAAAMLGRYGGQTGWEIAPENAQRLEALGLDAEMIKSSRALVTLYALLKVAFFSSLVGLGSTVVGLVVIGVLPFALVLRGAWSWWRAADPAARDRELLVLGAACVVPVWYMVFTTHTIIHAFFMVRPMVWPSALLFAGTVFAIYQAAGTRPR